jgi:hypothetical protein
MQTEFKQSSPVIFAIFFAFVACLIGAVFLLIKPWIGAVAILAGLLIPGLVFYFGTSYVIRCNNSGFTVDESSKRKGKRHAEYRWTEITRTEYEEIDGGRRQAGDSSGPATYFSAFKGDERAFRVGRIRRFKDLIALFNSMTPQLAYTWEPRGGISIQLGALTAGKAAYVRVPRASAPPPLP